MLYLQFPSSTTNQAMWERELNVFKNRGRLLSYSFYKSYRNLTAISVAINLDNGASQRQTRFNFLQFPSSILFLFLCSLSAVRGWRILQLLLIYLLLKIPWKIPLHGVATMLARENLWKVILIGLLPELYLSHYFSQCRNYSYKQPQTAKGDLIEGFDAFKEMPVGNTTCPFIFLAAIIALEKWVTGIYFF